MGFAEKIQSPKDITHLEGEIPVNYLYTVGIAGERFLRELKENAKILGIRCSRCRLVHVPPRTYCEQCFERLRDWVELTSEGRIETFTICYFSADGNRLAEPEIIAAVKLNGATSAFVHRIRDANDRDIHIGMDVEAVFKEKGDRVGSFLDIAYFRPSRGVRSESH